jgi:hypothetical protein
MTIRRGGAFGVDRSLEQSFDLVEVPEYFREIVSLIKVVCGYPFDSSPAATGR